MTREEAIKLLTQYIDYDAETPDYYKMEEACKVAIKALEQEPCEDCISRAELINKTIKRNSIWLKITDSRGMNLQEIIDELPSIHPKPKTSRWISDKYGQHCDQCGNGINTPYKFCPFCGADMRESEKK